LAAEWPLGALELKVRDIDREVTFYERFGLVRLGGDPQHAVLGAVDRPLLRLTSHPDARDRARHMSGLYHFAILLPGETEVGGFLQRTLEERLPLTGTAGTTSSARRSTSTIPRGTESRSTQTGRGAIGSIRTAA